MEPPWENHFPTGILQWNLHHICTGHKKSQFCNKKKFKCCTVSKWRPNNRFLFHVISILAKFWKTTFSKEFFNEIWLKEGELWWRPLLVAACVALLRQILPEKSLHFMDLLHKLLYHICEYSWNSSDIGFWCDSVQFGDKTVIFISVVHVLCYDRLYLYCIAFNIASSHLLVLNRFHHATIYLYQGCSSFDKERCDKQAIITTHWQNYLAKTSLSQPC